jgi:hypothetical protein
MRALLPLTTENVAAFPAVSRQLSCSITPSCDLAECSRHGASDHPSSAIRYPLLSP